MEQLCLSLPFHFFILYISELYQITALFLDEKIAELFALTIFLFNLALPNQQPENSYRTVLFGAININTKNNDEVHYCYKCNSLLKRKC